MAKILIAEDDPSMRHFLAKALEDAGHSVTACGDGAEALDVLQDNADFTALVTDIVMPGVDGIELSQKALKAYPDLKIMYITGFAAVALDKRGIESPQSSGQSTVLPKPFHLKELVARVEALLEH